MYHLHTQPSNVHICRIPHDSTGKSDHKLADDPWLAVLAVCTSLSNLLDHTTACPISVRVLELGHGKIIGEEGEWEQEVRSRLVMGQLVSRCACVTV